MKTEELVKELIANCLITDTDKVTPSTKLEDLGADSLDSVEVLMALEDEFGLDIIDEDAEKMLTVSDIIEYVKKHTNDV